MNIEKTIAKRLFDDSPPWFQDQLIWEFGKETFIKADFENIKTFDDACRACGTKEEKFNDIWRRAPLDTIAYEKLKIIRNAIDPGFIPNWQDSNQKKYYPWFEVLSSGFGFDVSDDSSADSDAGVGSRLCFSCEEKSTYAGQQFLKIYEEFITIKN